MIHFRNSLHFFHKYFSISKILKMCYLNCLSLTWISQHSSDVSRPKIKIIKPSRHWHFILYKKKTWNRKTKQAKKMNQRLVDNREWNRTIARFHRALITFILFNWVIFNVNGNISSANLCCDRNEARTKRKQTSRASGRRYYRQTNVHLCRWCRWLIFCFNF